MYRMKKRLNSSLTVLLISAFILFSFFSETKAQINSDQLAINKGLDYLRNQQQENGQISGFAGISSWAAMTFAAAGINPGSVVNNGNSLLDFIAQNPPAADAAATDWERNLLAITASEGDPFNFNGTNYVQKLESFHNNSQLGALTQVNDDIFGLLALISAGNGSALNVKLDALAFILSHQLTDGGFSWSTTGTSDTDTTAAALQTLIAAQNAGINLPNLETAKTQAKNYLINIQNDDGGFPYSTADTSNTSTTAWATMALSASGITGEENNKARVFIRNSQEENGSFKWQPNTFGETFTTSYAVLALTGKFWPVKIFGGEIAPTIEPSPTPTMTITPTLTPTITTVPSPTATVTPALAISPTATPTAANNDIRNRSGYFRWRTDLINKIREFQKKLK